MSINVDVSLPEEIVMEILSWLPVKSLLRFKCVCKDWRALIQSSCFVNKHFNQPRNQSLLIGYHQLNSELEQCALFHDLNLEGEPPAHEDVEIHPLVWDEIMVGPVNGLFFVESIQNNFMAFWNPATQGLRFLPNPQPGMPVPYPLNCYECEVGLGYSNNEYKVVWLRSFAEPNAHTLNNGGVEVTVYNITRGSWRYHNPGTALREVPNKSLCNTHINGVYYWVYFDVYENSLILVSFDMGSEVFQETPIELEPRFDIFMSEALTLHNNDTLALIVSNDDALDHHDIWLMKEEGVWTKHLTIGPRLPWELLLPVGFWGKNMVVFNKFPSRELLAYNSETYESKNLGIQQGRCKPFVICQFKETLFE